MNGNGRSGDSRPERPFPRNPGSLREVLSLPVSCFFRVIREIVVRPGRGAMRPECKAVSGGFAVQIRPIAVPTGRGETMQGSQAEQSANAPAS